MTLRLWLVLWLCWGIPHLHHFRSVYVALLHYTGREMAHLRHLATSQNRGVLYVATALLWMCCVMGSVWAKDPEVIPYLDLGKYTGTWYEIAHLPNMFQNDCVGGSRATYTLLRNGDIQVDNACQTANSGEKRVRGIAQIEDPKTKSKLRVSFVEVLGVRLFWGDYWVLGIGQNYQYSVVGGRNRDYAWILSRTPVLSESELKAALAVLEKNGFDTQKLRYTGQL